MIKLDVEAVLGELEAICKANLNTKLAAIDTEKADGVTLAQVDPLAYYFQNLPRGETIAYNPFIFFGLDDPDVLMDGPHTLKKLTIWFILCLKDTAETRVYHTRQMRYTRALEEIFQEAFKNNAYGLSIKVSGLSPVEINDPDLGYSFRATGVRLETEIA